MYVKLIIFLLTGVASYFFATKTSFEKKTTSKPSPVGNVIGVHLEDSQFAKNNEEYKLLTDIKDIRVKENESIGVDLPPINRSTFCGTI